MAVYFDYQIKSPTVAKHTVISCHCQYPLVAVGSINEPDAGGAVTLYLDEGEFLEDSIIQRSTHVKSLDWHPSRKILAAGWESGEVVIWNENDHELHETAMHHKVEVNIIQWNPSGSRLATADSRGIINIWKVDQRGRLQHSPLYKHDVGSRITQVIFQFSRAGNQSVDLVAAAKAAVSGDENALDMFAWSATKSSSTFGFSSSDTIQVIFGTTDGKVHQINEKGHCSEKFSTDSPVKFLFYYDSRDIILTVTDSLMLLQHRIDGNGSVTELSKVKLSGQPAKSTIVWSGNGILASASGERVVRVLDMESDENYVLSLDAQSTFQSNECISCLAYSREKGVIAGGTDLGNVAMWHYKGDLNHRTENQANEDTLWELLAPCETGAPVVDLKWGAGKGFLAANCESTVTLLNEAIMNAHFNQKVGAVQVSPSQLYVDISETNFVHDLKTDIHIKGVYVTKTHTTIWNGKKVVVYEVAQNKSFVRAAGSFISDAMSVAVYEQNVYLLESGKVSIRTFQGTVKQELAFSEHDGEPVSLNICGSFMAVATDTTSIKVFDLSRREARQLGSTKNVGSVVKSINRIKDVHCNCNGSKVSIICTKANGTPDSVLYIWDVETDQVQAFDFKSGEGQEGLDDNVAEAQQQLTLDVRGRSPKSIFWSETEAQLFVCEATYVGSAQSAQPKSKTGDAKPSNENAENLLIVTMYSSADCGIVIQDHFVMDSSYAAMIGIEVPYYYFVKKTVENEEIASSEAASEQSGKHLIAKKTMRDFVGLENIDNTSKDAMIRFSYLSSTGNMDEAFKAIKAIKSGSVWENMARMCVKTKRLDVASVCLGNMGNVRGAKALRESQKEPEYDARVAMLAIQLGMLDEAERLYKQCNRYDLLNILYQASNSWPKALETAELHDRIHLRTTYYNYGKYLESIGSYASAIQQFERSDTFRFEVPRMLFDDTAQLESYVLKSKDRPLRKWWAQYMESVGEMDAALQFYESARDNLSLVRVNCYCGNLTKAADICNETGDKAACYHLARHYESQGDIKSAVHYFSRAQAYANAIRLARENEMDGELMNLALLSSPSEMLEAARYYENSETMLDKAVMLYHKAGSMSKAIELAFRTQQFGALQMISEDLDERTDPDMLNKCAEFFIDHGQFDRAVNLLIVGARYHEALEMCLDNHVTITEELAERMTLPKDHEDQEYRLKLLEKIAECAFKQGSYHLATKKFTQAGNKIKAMKSLLKSGDTEKIVFFAGVSRQKEIYVMAANYLQSLDWRKNPEIMKNIIGFYTKGRALDSLSSFYEACAQVEIDEYQNYEKAYGALTEAYKCMSKAKMKNTTLQEEKMANLKQKAGLIKKFIQAKKAFEEDPQESMRQLKLLLEDPDVEDGIRIGDVYGFMIEYYAKAHDNNQAYVLMKELRQRIPSVNMAYYVSLKTIENIHKALDIPLGRGVGADTHKNGFVNGNSNAEEEDEEEEDFVEEAVPDEPYDDDEDDEYI